MKKFVLLVVLVAMLSTLLCACGKFTCDLCGEEKSGKKHKEEVLGEKVVICDDCYKGLEELAGLGG